MTTRWPIRFIASLMVGAAAAILACERSHAQQTIISTFVTDADVVAAQGVQNFRCKIMPVQPGFGVRAPGQPNYQANLKLPYCQPDYIGSGEIPFSSGQNDVGGAGFAGTDMTYHGGPVVQSAQSYLLFLNCNQNPTYSCWGNPGGFLNDLAVSDFIHITDQYVNATANGRYTLAGTAINLTGTEPHVMQVSHIQAAVIAGVRALFPNGGGGGYDKIYNLSCRRARIPVSAPASAIPRTTRPRSPSALITRG